MEILYGVIMTLLVGVMACVFASIVISKIGEEQRRNADYAMLQIEKIFNKFPQMVMDTFLTVQRLDEEQNKRKAKEMGEKQIPTDLFKGLDDDLVI